ncbi:hypothetical protein [Homoserinimonas hongtaonis]|uniref:Uncharacterized protein n=1 Tax=Homoserinimonas hongtaonis TaxID=2079791 RepID=A0A2U1SYA1_9MICO|nr:hypothetical protein [Salinibacterium hongtaonis]AWB89162.1 hypothetical protein C2138_06080 [Salinibacterium hongtaonis]PWB96610.1 hypothetical protein DF220_01235 [Salinibacterium hongtaonis]
MRHSPQDAFDTAARRASNPSTAWHPILAAVETEPGRWYMVDATNKCYGIIRFLAINGYRVVTWAERSEDRRLIGYYTSLKAAAVATHHLFVRSHGQSLPEHLPSQSVRGSAEP